MEKLTHPSLVKLVDDIIERIPETASGTYNRQDPTAWSKGSLDTDYKGTPINLSYHDCTWGIELRISIRNKTLGEFYLTWDQEYNGKGWDTIPSVIPRQDKKGLIVLLARLRPKLEIVPNEDYWADCPHGSPSMYE